MEFIFIILSWMILLVPGFDDSVPPTGDKIFKIETSPDIVESIKVQSDGSFDLWGFDIILKQNSTGTLDLKIPKNLPTPASFIGFWAYDPRAYVMVNGAEINYDVLEDPCYVHYKIQIEDETKLEVVYSVIAAGAWQLYSPIQFDKDNPCYSKVFDGKSINEISEQTLPFCTSDRTACFDQDGYKCDPRGWECENTKDIFSKVIVLPPLKQIKDGIQFHNVKCNADLELVYRNDHKTSACVILTTKIELMVRGWADDMRVITGCFGERYDMCYPSDKNEYRKALYGYYFGDDNDLPSSSTFEFTRLHSINGCNEKPQICLGEFDNGTKIRVACDYPIHSCLVPFDRNNYKMEENEN